MMQNLQSNIDDNNAEILDKVEGLTDRQKAELEPVLEMYSGPIPHPKILEEYDRIYPGAAKKIIQNGLGETSHRRHLENARVYGKMLLSAIALIGFFVLSGGFLFSAYLLVNSNHQIVGTLFGGVGFLGLFGSILNLIENFMKKDDLKENEYIQVAII